MCSVTSSENAIVILLLLFSYTQKYIHSRYKLYPYSLCSFFLLKILDLIYSDRLYSRELYAQIVQWRSFKEIHPVFVHSDVLRSRMKLACVSEVRSN